MALKLIKDFTVSGGVYTSVINASNPLTVEQDGSIDDITLIPYKAFYIYNDGKRTDDGYTASGIFYKYENVVITPKPFSTTVKVGQNPHLGTRIYLTETVKQVPNGTGNLRINVGTVLKATVGVDTEKMLVKAVGSDVNGEYADVIRQYKSGVTSVDIVSGMTIDASCDHIFLSKTTDFSGITGGSALTMNNINNEITNPNSNTNHVDVLGKYQTIYVKAVPQLNKIADTASPNYLGRIPTQFKTDVYFEVAYRELPDAN